MADNRHKSIELLNRAVAEELTAVHQYMYFHFHCEDMGYKPLAALFHRISIREMIHVEEFAERIIYLKGDVKMALAKPVEYIRDVKKMLEYSNQLELTTVQNYNEWAAQCAANHDAASKKLFEDILKEEEDHQDIFDTESENLGQFGDTFLALQAIEHSKEIAEK